MASSSVPDGFSVTFQFPAGSSQHKALVTILQAQWAEIGVDVDLVELDESTLADNLFSYEYEISMPFLKWTSDVLVPDEFALLMTDLTENMLGYNATPESLATLRVKLGLDRTVPEQFLGFVSGAIVGDFGESILKKQSVASLVSDRAKEEYRAPA